MNERQTVGVVAVATHSRLGDAPAVHLHPGAECAHLALEERLLHLRDQLRRADHHAVDGDQLIDVCGRGNAEGLARSRHLTFAQRVATDSRKSHTKRGMKSHSRVTAGGAISRRALPAWRAGLQVHAPSGFRLLMFLVFKAL